MPEGGSSSAARNQDHEFAQLLFSWSLGDILNENLYEHQMEKIPFTFQSEEHYFHSFVYPLLEETRTELASTMKMMYNAPFAEFSSFRKAKGKDKMMYDVTVGTWRNSERRKEPYRTLPGDLFILAKGEPGSVSDLQSLGSTWAFLLVNYSEDDGNGTPVQFKVTASQNLEFHDGMFVVFLMNITTQKRIWNSLHKHANLDIIKEILYRDSVVKEKCDMCSLGFNSPVQRFDPNLLSRLNESQKAAIMACIRKMECCHKSSVEQIWGPPGTGKTMTVSVMLSIFLQMKCRTLTCAPTNVAIVAVASRVLSLVRESSKTITACGVSFCSIGDILLFGNKERLKVGTNIQEIYLEHRVQRLIECLGSYAGWRHCVKSMIDLLEDCVSQYRVFVENESLKEEQLTNENKSKTKNMKVKSFMEFMRERFSSCLLTLKRCIVTFCTHIPQNFMKQENLQTMVSLLDNLSSLESLLSQKNLVSEELENIFFSKPLEEDLVKSGHMSSINSVRIMSLSLLKTLRTSLGGLKLPGGNRDAIERFCYERASLIFCTTSTSYKLQKFKIEPLKLLVIDEAAQMKECEAIIPLQVPGMKHAILIGDECQLPATVKSNVSSECGLGRSLFERLSSLGHSKHLLNVQYRMHPKISSFPNCKFYQNKIRDAQNVTSKSYTKQYLSGKMFGSYSFINIVGGREEGDDVGSKRNMVEVSIVIKIVQILYTAWQQSKKKVSIGIVSPYTAQVVSIEEKLRYKYENRDGFTVNVKSIDGFQGGEEDIIILSTVRSNSRGSVGFISSPQRTNVALTRARHCLWILGNERTLARSDSIWKDLVFDARNRNCLFDADADKSLKKIIIEAKKDLEPLNDMLKGNSLLLKHVKWKILFSDNFRKSFGKLMDSRMKNLVVDFLQKLSGGWRPNDGNTDCKTLPKVLKMYKVEGLHVIWTTDIIKDAKYIQVLKVWDVLPLKEIPQLRKELDNMFATYTDDYMNRCTTKHLEGTFEIPKSWVASQKIIQFRNVSNCEGDNEMSESLLHMKFYSLSPGMVNHLRFGRDIDLPVQLSNEQMDVFLCSKSSFMIGRLGTGKTTILTMKFLQKEQSFRAASQGFHEAECSRVRDTEVVDDHQESRPNVEETDDEHSNGGLSLSELVLEKQSSNESTQDVGIKKKKGRNKGRWMKKNKGSNSLNTFTGEKHSNDLSLVSLVLEKQTSNENTKGVEIKKGNGKNMEKWIRENQGSNSLNTVTSDEHSKDHPRVELKLEKQVSNENTKDVEIKKGKGKNVDIWLKNSKCSNSVNTFTSDEHTYNDHSLEKFVVVKQSSNEYTQHAEIKKGKGKSKSNTDGKSLNTFTTVLVDGQHFIKESTTSHGVHNACKDLNQSSSASDRSQPEEDLPVSKSDEMTTGQTFVERLQNRPVVDGFLSYVGSESSNISEALHVEEIVHDHNIREYSPQELVLEKQSSDDNTRDLEDKKRKGKYVAGEDTTMHEANSACNDVNVSSSAFDTRITTVDAVKCGSFLGLAVAFLGISMWKKT